MATNDEFIREVDEEYRRDRIAQIWKQYSGVIVGLALVVVAGIAGWRLLEHRRQLQAEAAADRFQEAIRLPADKSADAEAALIALLAQEAGAYGPLVRFRLAAQIGAKNAEEGAAAFDKIAADSGLETIWQDLARLRAAQLRMDSSDPSQAKTALTALAVPGNAWRHSARELLGLMALKANDMTEASRWFDQIAADRETPASLRQRLEGYTAQAAGGPVKPAQ